jgi:hypothetical protein
LRQWTLPSSVKLPVKGDVPLTKKELLMNLRPKKLLQLAVKVAKPVVVVVHRRPDDNGL